MRDDLIRRGDVLNSMPDCYGEVIENMPARLADVETLKDAARYRFLREEQTHRKGAVFVLSVLGARVEDFDKVIDTAMNGRKSA